MPGSGAVRYAAAMYFYQHGAFSAELLELYRRCLNLDAEDVVELAASEGVEFPKQLVRGDGS